MTEELRQWRKDRAITTANTKGMNMNLDKIAKLWLEERNLLEDNYDHLKLVGFLTEEISEGISRSDDEHESVDWRVDCIVFLVHSLLQDGYSPEKCLIEGYKEISSRTGAVDKATGKWEKFKTDKAKANWYKANYSKAKLWDYIKTYKM